jgi:hypothetical protein
MLSLLLSHLRQLQDDNDKGQQQQRHHPTHEHDGSLANLSGLNLFPTMDEEELVIDSPEQEAVEDEDLEDVDDNLKLGESARVPKPAKDKDANREQVRYSHSKHRSCVTALTDYACTAYLFLLICRLLVPDIPRELAISMRVTR